MREFMTTMQLWCIMLIPITVRDITPHTCMALQQLCMRADKKTPILSAGSDDNTPDGKLSGVHVLNSGFALTRLCFFQNSTREAVLKPVTDNAV